MPCDRGRGQSTRRVLDGRVWPCVRVFIEFQIAACPRRRGPAGEWGIPYRASPDGAAQGTGRSDDRVDAIPDDGLFLAAGSVDTVMVMRRMASRGQSGDGGVRRAHHGLA